MLSNVMYHLLGEDAGDKTHLELSATFFWGLCADSGSMSCLEASMCLLSAKVEVQARTKQDATVWPLRKGKFSRRSNC